MTRGADPSLQCANCGHENPSDAKFCSQCGTALPVVCPVCSTPAQPDARFCSNCGSALHGDGAEPSPPDDLTRYLPRELLDKLRSARAGHAMRGERRTVTVLFADIKGSTAAAEQLDPEDWASIVNGAFEHLIAPIYRFEGTLAHLQGDAVLAMFGAPIAHEDDPVRALRAGLEIIDAIGQYREEVTSRWGFPVEVRVGVNTGLVVVGEVGSDLRVEYTALGDAINIAARMEQTAQPGTVQVTGETLSLTGGVFEVEELGPIAVKGKSVPIDAYRVVRFVGGGDQPTQHAMVGRAGELDTLNDLRSRLASGAGWISSVIGDAGVGKSKLLTEFRRHSVEGLSVADRFDQQGDVFWMYGLSRSYDSTNPYVVIREMLGRWWSGDGISPTFDRVSASVDTVGLSDPDAAALLGFIGGVAMPEKVEQFISTLETPVLQSRATETVVEYLSALSERRPGLIVIEDLHWADDLSLALTERMMDLTEQSPIGLILAMRPYREDPSWRIHEVADRNHHHRYTHLDLTSLNEADGNQLIDSLLAEPSLDDDLRRRILERADGNPLFIEQTVLSLQEAGAGELTVPTSLSGILTARLDRLDDESKFFVQMASVLGSEFGRDTLAGISGLAENDRLVVELLKRGILIEREPGTLGFRHALFQETAYSTILLKTRKELHRRVADYLVDNDPQAIQNIARHMAEADVTEAFPYLVEAGIQASRTMALSDAIRLFTTAIENMGDNADPELVERAHSGLGEAYALVPDLSQAAASYQQLYEYGEREGRPSTRVAALNHLGYTTAAVAFDLEEASRYLEDARQLAEEVGDEAGLAQYHMNACFVASLAGRISDAVAHDEQTVALGEKIGVDSIRFSGLVRRATNYAVLLDQEKGVPALEAALQAAADVDRDDQVADMRFAAGLFDLADADLKTVVETAEEVQPTLDRYYSFYAGMNQLRLGFVKYLLGDLEGALSHYAESRRLAIRLGQPFVITGATAGMALIYSVLGLSEPIDELRETVLGNLEESAGEFMATSAWADLGFSSLYRGFPGQAEDELTRGLSASSMTQYFEKGRLLCGLAWARAERGDVAGASADVAAARDFTSSKSFHLWDALIDYTEGDLLYRAGELARAGQILARAEATAAETGQLLLAAWIRLRRAEVSADSGEDDQAMAHREAAVEMLETIASMIDEASLVTAFREKWLAPLTAELERQAGT